MTNPQPAPGSDAALTRSEQARQEMTRDPIFLLQRRIGRDKWHTESVWLTRVEAENHARANAHNLLSGFQVYCVPAGGELARMLRESDAEDDDPEVCLVCGKPGRGQPCDDFAAPAPAGGEAK